jgi:putative spermidine/putrescine transport system ATP-binding protein
MDEPLGALDKKLREHMQLEIKHIHESIGITVIYVTHDQSEALTMSDRIALMNEGRIEQVGTPTELYERPANHFVADFIGDTNLLSEMEVVGQKHGSLDLVCSSGLKLNLPAGEADPRLRISLAVRPERISILGGEEKRDQVFKGLVKEVVYLGDTYRYTILLDGCQEVTVNVKNDRSRQVLEKGREVRVGWNHDDVNLL